MCEGTVHGCQRIVFGRFLHDSVPLGRQIAKIMFIGAVVAAGPAITQPMHGISMYGQPALPRDYEHLTYVNPDAPTGGRIVTGEVGSFDSLNPHIRQGSVPWQLRFLAYESLMGRSWDEPFTLYGSAGRIGRGRSESHVGGIHAPPRGAVFRRQPGHGRGRDLVLRDAGHRRPPALPERLDPDRVDRGDGATARCG